jgi:hypothetical protein
MHLAIGKSTEGSTTPSSEKIHTEANAPHQLAGEAPPRTFRLKLRARRGRWNAITIFAVAGNIGGFRRAENGRWELPGVLKAEPRARIECACPRHADDVGSEFHVVMDLDSCCCNWCDTFDHVLQAAQQMAAALGADILDATGEPFTDQSTAQEKARVEAVLAERTKAREIIRVLPDGTRVKQGLISCHSERQTKRGRYLGEDRFDVPALGYYPGAIHGYRLMLELLDTLRAHTSWDTNHRDVKEMLKAAVSSGKRDFDAPSKGNVADSVIDIAAYALSFFANHSNYMGFIERQIQQEERSCAWMEEAERREKAEFVARMREARELKAATIAEAQP